jgi:hypothetical protein
MKVTSTVKMLLGAVALTVAGNALANTNLSTLSPGSIVVNVLDFTNNTSFAFDTGLTTTSFNGASTYNFNVGTDANWTAFLAGRGSSADQLAFDVTGVVAPTFTAGIRQAWTTSSSAIATANWNLTQAATTGRNYYNAVNQNPSTTTTSTYAGSGANPTAQWNTSEVSWSQMLGGATDISTLGTGIDFYSVVQNGAVSGSRTIQTFVTKFAGQWNITDTGAVSYAAIAAPLPASWTLILSGLALMGVIARRRKSANGSDDFSLSAVAG